MPLNRVCIVLGGSESYSPIFPPNDPSLNVVSHSLVEGGWPGDGNIDVDPLFVDQAGGDYRLSALSPCIDAGSNEITVGLDAFDLDGNPRFAVGVCGKGTSIGRPIDMGCYEFQRPRQSLADLNGDCLVDGADLGILVNGWGDDAPSIDVNLDGQVDGEDLGILLSAWGSML